MRRLLAAVLSFALALLPGAEAFAHGGGNKQKPSPSAGTRPQSAPVPKLPVPILSLGDLGVPPTGPSVSPLSIRADHPVPAPPAAAVAGETAFRRAGRATLNYSGLSALGRLLSYGNTVEKWADELSDPEQSVETRLAAARRLYERALPETIEVLGSASVHDADPAVREAAKAGVLAISAKHLPRFKRDLRLRLLTGRRVAAARALGFIARHDERLEIVEALAYQGAMDIRQDARLAAIEALSTAASPKAADRLSDMLKRAGSAAQHSAVQLALISALKGQDAAGRPLAAESRVLSPLDAKLPVMLSALKKVVVITPIFLLIEGIGSWFTGSLSLKADATHMALDWSISLGTLVATWLAMRPRDSRRTYGFLKAEPIMGLLSSAAIVYMGYHMGVDAYERFSAPTAVPGLLTMGLAFAGLASNALTTMLLYRYRGHGSVKGAFKHAFLDALGSIGVIVGGLLIWGFGWAWADPIITIGIIALLARAVWGLGKDSLAILLDSVPAGIKLDQVEADLLAAPGAVAVRDLHVWSLNSSEIALTAVLYIRPDADHEAALSAAKAAAKAHGATQTTIQVETLKPVE